MRNSNSKIYATAETIVFFIILLLLLWFVTFDAVKVDESNEVEVFFEESRMGGRAVASSPAESRVEDVSSSAVSKVMNSEERLVSDDKESPYMPSEEELEVQREAEAERLRQEERLREEAVKREREQQAIAKANALGNLFGKQPSESEGVQSSGQGIGTKGNPVGHGSLNGNSWSLDGRDCVSLPRPSNNFKQEGKVVINIHVDELGNVISARVGAGSTISDAQTQELARKAAMNAKFSTAQSRLQMGSITYSFKLR